MTEVARAVLEDALARKKNAMEGVTADIASLADRVRERMQEQRDIQNEIDELEASLND